MRIVSILAILGLMLSAGISQTPVTVTTSGTSHPQGNGLGAPPTQPTNPTPVSATNTQLGPGQSCTDSHGTVVRCDTFSGQSGVVVTSQHVGTEWLIKEIKGKAGCRFTVWNLHDGMTVTVERGGHVDIASGDGGTINMGDGTSANTWGAGGAFNDATRGQTGYQSVGQGPGAGFTITSTPGSNGQPGTVNINSSPNSFNGINSVTSP